MKKNKKVMLLVLAIVICVLLAIAISFLIDAKTLNSEKNIIKASLKATVSDVKSNDFDKAQDDLNELQKSTKRVETKLNTTKWKVASKLPLVGNDITSAKSLISILNEVMDKAATPSLNTLEQYPLDSLKVNDGFNVKNINAYLKLADKVIPILSESKDDIDSIDFRFIKLGTLKEYKQLLVDLITTYTDHEDYINLLKAFIGDGTEDKLYVFVAQNTSEIRAGGGFPGSVGTIEIKDGILTVGEFSSVVNTLPRLMPAGCNITAEENDMFGGWLGMHRDATFIPDFERAGEIWAIGYESMNGEKVDGVVSALPQIIQKFLKIFGPISLDDKYTLSGDNATRVIEKDIYFDHFFKDNYTSKSNEITDNYFSQTAKLTMEKLVENISIKNLPDFIDVFEESIEDRSFMMWLKDEDGQELVRKVGAAATLNYDKDNPETGVYISCRDGDRLGIFATLDVEMSKPTKNKDGSCTYDMKVVLGNSMTKEIQQNARGYILGSYGGDMYTLLHLFAPMGGTVSDFKTSNDMNITIGEYKGLQVGYANHFFVYPGKPITITYKVTTAPGVDTPLKLIKTPTLQEYVK
ncbi:MAG: DUF4012 domain-containing protein [Oscillospiraceae bacterium]|nr:DUF4012 domain-containing protein [Candidatus Limimonas egerieequi]